MALILRKATLVSANELMHNLEMRVITLVYLSIIGILTLQSVLEARSVHMPFWCNSETLGIINITTQEDMTVL